MIKILLGVLLLAPFFDDGEKPGPLKVYILAGQSNMQGHAKVHTLQVMAGDPKTAPLFKEMTGPHGNPRTCENVRISYCTGGRSGMGEGFGKLTAGYGAPTDPAEPGDRFGPEYAPRRNTRIIPTGMEAWMRRPRRRTLKNTAGS